MDPTSLFLLSSSEITAATAIFSHRQTVKRPHQPQQLVGPTRSLDPYKSSFLMSSSTFTYLCGLLDPLLSTHDPFPNPKPMMIPGPTRLSVALSRISLGHPYPTISLNFSLPIPTVLHLTRHLARVLTTNFRFHLLNNNNYSTCSISFASTSYFELEADDSSSRIVSISTRRKSESKSSGSCPEEGSGARRAARSLMRWGVMGRLEEEERKLGAAFVGTCAILHNLLLQREDYSALAEEEEDAREVKRGRRS